MAAPRPTHPRRRVHPPEAFHDERYWPGPPGTPLGQGTFIPTLKRLTPIVGDTVRYETWAGDILNREDARRRLDTGETLYYTTWEIDDE